MAISKKSIQQWYIFLREYCREIKKNKFNFSFINKKILSTESIILQIAL